MVADNSFFTQLRQQIDAKHREAIRALETIASYMLEPTTTVPVIAPPAGATPPKVDVESSSNVERVLGAIRETSKTVEQIASELGMDAAAVRGALYGKVGYKRAERVRKGKKVSFKLKPEKPEKQSTIVFSGKLPAGKSIAAMVREFLELHKDGVKTSDVTAAVLKNAPGKYKAVGAALYNLKLAGKVKHDEANGIYTLIDAEK